MDRSVDPWEQRMSWIAPPILFYQGESTPKTTSGAVND
jgi:hypothetical protein